jgi:hypothetical protein
VAFCLIAAGALGSTDVEAGEQNLLKRQDPWKRIDLRNKRPTAFRISKGTVEVVANGSVAFLYREIQPFMGPKPRLEWQWRVDKNIPATDQSIPKSDDRPLAVHLWFDEGSSSLLGSVTSLLGRPRVGHLITYVWGGTRPAGTVLPNPHYPEKGVIIILRNDPDGSSTWLSERRDIVADFKRSFGKEPKLSELRYIAVSGDTDDSQTSSRSRLRRLSIKD